MVLENPCGSAPWENLCSGKLAGNFALCEGFTLRVDTCGSSLCGHLAGRNRAMTTEKGARSPTRLCRAW